MDKVALKMCKFYDMPLKRSYGLSIVFCLLWNVIHHFMADKWTGFKCGGGRFIEKEKIKECSCHCMIF
jgi:hypothetical protein